MCGGFGWRNLAHKRRRSFPHACLGEVSCDGVGFQTKLLGSGGMFLLRVLVGGCVNAGLEAEKRIDGHTRLGSLMRIQQQKLQLEGFTVSSILTIA